MVSDLNADKNGDKYKYSDWCVRRICVHRRGRETDVDERRQQTTKMLRRESESEAEAEKRVCTAAYTGSNYRLRLKLNAKLQ